jgi:hypothetical protein
MNFNIFIVVLLKEEEEEKGQKRQKGVRNLGSRACIHCTLVIGTSGINSTQRNHLSIEESRGPSL